MPKTAPPKAQASAKRRRAIALDPDRLGMVAGGLTACIVLLITLMLRQVDVFEAIVRAGVVVVVSYAVIFILVLAIKRITLTEIARQREAERERVLKMNQQDIEKRQGGRE